MKKSKVFTITNILILIITICYIADRYLIPIPEGYDGFTFAPDLSQIEGIENYSDEMLQIMNKSNIIMGFCGGVLTDKLALIGKAANPNGQALYRHFTVVFTHGFLFHILVNMIGLFIVGNFVEKKLGSKLTLFLFFITGFIETYITDPVWQLVSGEDISTQCATGASGAVFGLIGVALAMCLLNKKNFKDMSTSKKIILAIYGVVFTYLANGSLISWTMFAHNIGLIVGLVLMFILAFIPNVKKKITEENE